MFNKSKAMTLYEIVISLTLVGIIAVLAIPIVSINVHKSKFKAQKQALASSLFPVFRYMTVKYKGSLNNIPDAETFASLFSDSVTGTKVCDGTETPISDCGWDTSKTYSSLNSSEHFSIPTTYGDLVDFADESEADTKLIGIKTYGNMSLLVAFNKECTDDLPCANIIYDVNGSKNGPNTQGVDVGFMTVFNPQKPRLAAPLVVADSGEDSCAYGENANATLPTEYEAYSIYHNQKLMGVSISNKNSIASMKNALTRTLNIVYCTCR